MEKKTIGAFIAALRKANGITQQELADKLNISNKAVSRWERDECAPDITLIPALAEILGVTCDELLKGERILSDTKQERSEPKIEKQIKALCNRAISNFKTLIWISLALSIAGLFCMLGITYGFFRSVIGFAVMGLFDVNAFVIGAIATSRLKEIKGTNELFENADESLIERYDKTLGQLSYAAFFSAIAVAVISLTIMLPMIEFDVALSLNASLAAALLFGILFFVLKDKYCSRITEQPKKKANTKLVSMNCLQLGLVLIASILFFIRPYFDEPDGSSAIVIFHSLAYALLSVSAVIFIIFISVCKADRNKLALSGARNLLLAIPAALLQIVHSSRFYNYGDKRFPRWVRFDDWHFGYIHIVLAVTLLIFVIFELVKKFIIKRCNVNKEV